MTTEHREELKDEYHYPNSVVYQKNDEIQALKAELRKERAVVDYYAENFETRGNPEWYKHDIINQNDLEDVALPNLGLSIKQGGRLARLTQLSRIKIC